MAFEASTGGPFGKVCTNCPPSFLSILILQTYQIGGNNGADDDVLATIGLEVRQFDQEALDNNYIPIWALIITWEGVPQPVDDPLLYPNRVSVQTRCSHLLGVFIIKICHKTFMTCTRQNSVNKRISGAFLFFFFFVCMSVVELVSTHCST